MSELESYIQQCRSGDPTGFEGIVRETEPQVRAVIASMAPDPGAVPDLVQEVFVIAYRKLDAYQPGTNFSAWIKAIARNVAQNERRRWYSRRELADRYQAEVDAEQQIAQNIDEFVDSLPEETLEALRECVGGLPGKTKALVDGYYYGECSIKQVCELLNVKASAAKVALHRARQAIGKCLGRKGNA